MVLVPPRFDDIDLLDRAKALLAPCGFGSFSVTTAADHDRMIAFTSQMPHIISNAFIKSPTALEHKGFSAGSYRDLTRVAWLNPGMWAELFLENQEYVLSELDTLLSSLALDPRPGYLTGRSDPYGFPYVGKDVRFYVEDGVVKVFDVVEGL